MKKIKYRLLLWFYFSIISMLPFVANAQLNAVANMDIDEGASFVGPYFENISDTVKLVGLGAVQGRLKEPSSLNNAIVCYLVKNKAFNRMLIHLSDWELRPFSSYLYSDKALIVLEFDSLFNKTFKGTFYHTKEFRKLFSWLKKHNLAQKANRVLLVGGGLLEDRNKFSLMNSYFINSYVRPFSPEAADSLSKNWEAAKAKPVKEFDSTVLNQMFDWKEAVNKGKVQMPDVLKYYIEFDYSQRRASYESTLLNTSGSNNTAELYHAGRFRFRVVEALMRERNSKTILHTNNIEAANAQIYLRYDNTEVEMPFNGIEYKRIYKDSYLNTGTTFADSATVWGMDNNVEKKTVLHGDKNTQILLQEKPVYSAPGDNAILLNLNIPVLNYTVSKQYGLYMKRKEAESAFDMVFIFSTLTCDDPAN